MAGPIGTKFGTNLRIRLEWTWAKYKSPLNTPGGFRGSQIQQSGDALKQLDWLAPDLVHVCGFAWEWT